MAEGNGLTVSAPSGQEALLRFAVESRRLAEAAAVPPPSQWERLVEGTRVEAYAGQPAGCDTLT